MNRLKRFHKYHQWFIANSKGLHAKGIGKGIERAVERIKENNIYNKDFQIKK